MDRNDYTNLPDGVYEFKTYMDETIIGIPYKGIATVIDEYFYIPPLKISELNNSNDSIEFKISVGILISINPDIIDNHKKIK